MPSLETLGAWAAAAVARLPWLLDLRIAVELKLFMIDDFTCTRQHNRDQCWY
jgi:hypothetical protein